MPRNDFVTKPATLDSFSVKVDFRNGKDRAHALVHVEGRCERRKKPLWSSVEHVPLSRSTYAVHDHVIHVTLVAEVERPTTQAEFERQMMGAAWEQPELPL